MSNERAAERVWTALADEPRRGLEESLSPTDLQTLLIDVAARRSARRTPAQLMQRWREDRYVQPSATDPRALAHVVARLWNLLPAAFEGIELSPVAPLGTCSVVGPVHQDRVLSTVRNTEVVSDLTNALALQAATVRRSGRATVHLAACHRVLRMQPFEPPNSQHFQLFGLVSATRDRGGGTAEAALLVEHVTYWLTVLADVAPDANVVVTLSSFDSPVLAERLHDTVLPGLGPLREGVTVVEDADRQHARGYYTGAALAIEAGTPDAMANLGDGGLTTWTAKLLADDKERCLVSCLSTERLTELARRRHL